MGCSPTSTMGLGLISVSSARRVPRPPARMTTFIRYRFLTSGVSALVFKNRLKGGPPARSHWPEAR